MHLIPMHLILNNVCLLQTIEIIAEEIRCRVAKYTAYLDTMQSFILFSLTIYFLLPAIQNHRLLNILPAE